MAVLGERVTEMSQMMPTVERFRIKRWTNTNKSMANQNNIGAGAW
jgi:hypothetical protein